MIPSFLGNAIGGGLFTGAIYWYLFLAGNEVEIHFDTMPMDTAVHEQGGPLQSEITSTGAGTAYGNGNGLKGRRNRAVPDSGNNGVSGLARELHGKLFKRNKSSSIESSA